MDGRQTIYYALGILTYAIAKSDGEVQPEEREKLFEIVKKNLDHNIDFDYAEIIFQLLEKQNQSYEQTYVWAISEFQKARHYLTPELKDKAYNLIQKVADAVNSVSVEEQKLIERFKRDIEGIQ